MKYNKGLIKNICKMIILGAACFSISAFVVFTLTENLDWGAGIIMIWLLLTGGIGILLLGIFQRNLLKKRVVGAVVVAAFVTFLVILLLGYIMSDNNDDMYGFYLILCPVMGIIYGATFGGIFYGPKAILMFSIVCGAVAVPFGNLSEYIGDDIGINPWMENLIGQYGDVMWYVPIWTGIGAGIGLCLALAKLKFFHARL